MLRHHAHPYLRSYLINWLAPLGTGPHVVAAELERIESTDSAGRRSANASMVAVVTATSGLSAGSKRPGSVEGILFHPETSTRRALILALGNFGFRELSEDDRELLVAQVA